MKAVNRWSISVNKPRITSEELIGSKPQLVGGCDAHDTTYCGFGQVEKVQKSEFFSCQKNGHFRVLAISILCANTQKHPSQRHFQNKNSRQNAVKRSQLKGKIGLFRSHRTLKLAGGLSHRLTKHPDEVIQAAESAGPRDLGNVEFWILKQILGSGEPLIAHIGEHGHSRFCAEAARKMVRRATELPRQRFHRECRVRQAGTDQFMAMANFGMLVREHPPGQPLRCQQIVNDRDG